MILSHKIELDARHKQRRYFTQAAGTSRFVWNWALAEWNRQCAAGEKPIGIKLKREFNAVKYEQFPWLRGIHRDAHSQPFANLQKAFSKFFKGTAKRPRFHKKGRKDSFYVANDRVRYVLGEKMIRLPVIGTVRLREPLRFTGKIMSATVSRTADRWFISIQVDVGDYTKERTGDDTVGVDLGLKVAATLSTGEKLQSPKPLKAQLGKLRRANKQLSRRKKGSKNRERSKKKLARVYARIANIRQDWLHKTTTRLCRENQTVVIEDLSVRNMMKNKRLARSIGDIGWSEFRRQLEYKSAIYGTSVVVADRFYPSSKSCSNCGHIKTDLALRDRTYECDSCGLILDRDVNASENLRTLGLRGIACGSSDNPGSDAGAGRVETGTKPCPIAGTI